MNARLALDAAREVPPMIPCALGVLARALLARGRVADAVERAREATA